MNHAFINTLKPGETIISYYILNRVAFKTGKNSQYLEFELQDVSGIIRGVYWNGTAEDAQLLANCNIVKIKAEVITYQDRIELKIDKFRPATEEDDVDMDALIEISQKNVEEMKRAIETTIEEIDNIYIRSLLEAIFYDEHIKQSYFEIPAGKRWHHSYKHGLLEHIYNMLRLGQIMTEFYPDLDKELLISGILLHDIGKIWEYSNDIRIDYTDAGRLHGHIVMGYHFVMKKCEAIEDFPESLKIQIGHLILSHQGELENASPVVPMTLEAMVLHHIDDLDAKANAISRVIRKDKQPNSNWTNYNKLMGRFFYSEKDWEQS
ncbi:MAG: HD domain-containing protein [Calditrichia bacterium]